MSKFRDSELRIDPGEKVFLIHHDGSIVKREVDYVLCNMEGSLSIYIDSEGEFSEEKKDICFFNSIEEAKSFRDKMTVDFAIFVERPNGKYYSTFDSNYDLLMRGSIHPESLDVSEDFLDYLEDFDYIQESHFLFAVIIHNADYSIPFTGYAVYYVSDERSKKVEYPCLFKEPISKVQELSSSILGIDDQDKLEELFSKVFLTSSDIFTS